MVECWSRLFLLFAGSEVKIRCGWTMIILFKQKRKRSGRVSLGRCWVKQCNNTIMLRLLLLYEFWLAEIYMCHKSCPARRDLWPTNCTPKDTHASVFYTSGTPHARHVHAHFKLWGRPFCLSLLASFFLLVLLWKELLPHSFVATFHFCS